MVGSYVLRHGRAYYIECMTFSSIFFVCDTTKTLFLAFVCISNKKENLTWCTRFYRMYIYDYGHSYVGDLGPMGLYGPIAMLWNGGADQLKFPADQLKLHGCVHFTKETCVCGFKMSKKWSFGQIRNDARPIVAAGRPRIPALIPPPLNGGKFNRTQVTKYGSKIWPQQ